MLAAEAPTRVVLLLDSAVLLETSFLFGRDFADASTLSRGTFPRYFRLTFFTNAFAHRLRPFMPF